MTDLTNRSKKGRKFANHLWRSDFTPESIDILPNTNFREKLEWNDKDIEKFKEMLKSTLIYSDIGISYQDENLSVENCVEQLVSFYKNSHPRLLQPGKPKGSGNLYLAVSR